MATNLNLTPTLDRVVIRREECEETTPGGIVLPTEAKKQTERGVVLAVGPGAFNYDGSLRPMSVKPGDCVIFTVYYEIAQGSKVVIVNDEDILAIADTGK